MSWYTNPQLFIYSYTHVYKVTKKIGINPIALSDLKEGKEFSFSKHLSLENNKESDFKTFKASFPKSGMFKAINCEGLVINWDHTKQTGAWSREEQDSSFWSLPGITKQKSLTEQALEKKVSDLETRISSLQNQVDSNKVVKEALDKRIWDLKEESSILEDEVNSKKVEKQAIDKLVLDLEAEVGREKDKKNAFNSNLKREERLSRSLEKQVGLLEKQVLELTSKLVHCCGVCGGRSTIEVQHISDQTVPRNWVTFGELDVLAFSDNTTLTITKATDGSEFVDDKTTNVQANCFYRGLFPVVVVDVADLTPNREKARFDPCVWGLYDNAGIIYAARKPFASEMSMHTRNVNMS